MIQKFISNLEEWSNHASFHFSVSKFTGIIFSNKPTGYRSNLRLYNKNFEFSSNQKILRIISNDKLTWRNTSNSKILQQKIILNIY